MNPKNIYIKYFLKLFGLCLIIIVFNYFLNNFTLSHFKRRIINLEENVQTIHGKKMVVDFRFEKTPKNAFETEIIELKLNNNLNNLNVVISINQLMIKKVTFKKKGIKNLQIEFDRKILKKRNSLKIDSNHIHWTIKRLKLKNCYGFSFGLLSFNIVNKNKIGKNNDWEKNTPSYERFILLLILSFIILVFLLPDPFLIQDTEKKFKLRKIIFWIWLCFTLSPILIQSISKYRIIYAYKTVFFLFMLVFVLLLFYRRVNIRNKYIIIPLLIFSTFLLSTFYEIGENHHHNDFSGFIRIRGQRIREVPLDKIPVPIEKLIIRKKGYDGMFFYLISFDPFLLKLDHPVQYRDFIDSPRYRYSRIGYPFLINLFSLGSPDIFPETMVLLILLSHLFAAFFLLKIIRYYKKNPYITFLYIITPGFMWSLRFVLPESIAGAFLLAGYYFYLKNKPILYIFCFSFSILIRETGILFVIILLLYRLIKDKKLKIPFYLGSSIIPFIIWRVYITFQFFSDYGISTFFSSADLLTFPFMGIHESYKALVLGTYRSTVLYSMGYIFPVILFLILIIAVKFILKEVNFLNISLLLYSVFYISLNYSVWKNVGNAKRVTFDIFIFLILAFIARKDKKYRILFYAIFIICLISSLFFTPTSHVYTFGLL